MSGIHWSKELDEKAEFAEFFPDPEDAELPEDGKWTLWGIAVAVSLSLIAWTLIIRGAMWLLQFVTRYVR
jgi:amino acid transporter